MQESPSVSTLEDFIAFLYGGLNGFVYLAARDAKIEGDWKQEFLHYPTEADKLVRTIQGASKKLDVFLCPAVFSKPSDLRADFKSSNVVWTEFDGNAPDWTDSIGEPSVIVQSSGPLNQHVYWRLAEPITDRDTLELINHRITYNMGADSSAFEANQVLRPPETINYKRDTAAPVFIVNSNDLVYDQALFDSLPPAPEFTKTEWEIGVLPDVQSVLLKYAFTPDIINLMKQDTVKDRSASLMNLAYGCAQLQLSDNEIMAVLLLADDKWEKFKYRKDRLKRLAHIIIVARNKYPDTEPDFDENLVLAFGFDSFLRTDIEIDWVIEPMLMDNGYMLMAGPSGVGKTQITMQILIHLALGKNWLHYTIPEPKKIMFLSLEMGHGELKKFAESMAGPLTDEEITLLETNLIMVPYGEPWPLNDPVGQSRLIELIEEYQPDGIAVDSIGSAIMGNISSDESVQPFINFNDKIRKKYNIFTWYIHHMRKVREGIAGQDDVYGNQYIFNRSTSSYGILYAKGGAIRIRNLKMRMHEREKDYLVVRDEHLMFHAKNEDVDELLADLGPNKAEGSNPVSDTTAGGMVL